MECFILANLGLVFNFAIGEIWLSQKLTGYKDDNNLFQK